MHQTQWIELTIALVLTVMASVLVLTEAALSGVGRARAEELVDQGLPGARRLARIAADPAPTLNAARFLRALCEVMAVILATTVVFALVAPTWERLLIAGGGMAIISFVAWGVAPRTIGRQRASSVGRVLAGPATLLTSLLGPIPQLMILFGNAVTPGRGYADGPFASEAELRELVDRAEASEVIESDERRMIHSVFDLGDTLVKEVMVPRTDIVYIPVGKTLRQAMSLSLRSGFSRIPVIRDGVDDICGVLYLKDVIRRVYDNPEAERHETVLEMMRPAEFTPDSKPVDELLKEMQSKRNHMVIVVDEFGGTAGLATIEDILEEIVGEIVDEYDREPTHTREVMPGVYRVSARMSVEELGELFGKDVDDDEVETVGGLMAKELNMVPIPGSSVEWEGIRIDAETVAGRRHQIDTCLVRLAPTPEQSDDGAGEGDDDDD